MRLLLDTHVVLWHLGGLRALDPAATRAISGADELRVSVVTFAEVGVKAGVGKLEVPSDFRAATLRAGLRLLELSADHGLAVARLPLHHRDPFDRLLIAQAQAEDLTVVTADRRFAEYGVPVVPA